MKILKMYATFGKLNEKTLDLSDGLNVIYGANESGESTWSAFLRVMLYGISTSERSKKDELADKEKYAPWSGAPMYGKIEFLWNDKKYILERTANRQGILQAATIEELETGKVLDIPEPVGETLLGVRREVFERTAFIAQASLAVSADKSGELQKKIVALATTGEEDFSQKQVLERLKKQSHKLKYNRSGRIPELENEIEEISAKLSSAREDARQMDAQHMAIEQLKAKQERIKNDIESLSAHTAQRELKYICDCERMLKESEERLEKHKSVKVLSQSQCEQIEENIKQFEEKEKNYTDCSQKCEKESELLAKINPIATKKNRALLWAAIVAVAGGVCAIFVKWWVALAVAAIIFIAVYFALNASFYKKLGVKNATELAEKNEEYLRQVRLVELLNEEKDAAFKEVNTARDKLSSVLNMVEENCSVSRANELISQADLHRETLHKLEAEVNQNRARAEASVIGRDRDALSALAAKIGDDNPPLESAEQLSANLAEARDECSHRERVLAALKERVSARGDASTLEARHDELVRELDDCKRDFDAIQLAIDTLSDIQTELQRRFAPEVEKRAAQIFKELTGGHFSVVKIKDASMNLAVAENDASTPHTPLELSGGTLDELYLAVRLALCEYLLSGDVPMILDDAFVNFDDERLLCALKHLERVSDERQVLIFTCHTREDRLADGGSVKKLSLS